MQTNKSKVYEFTVINPKRPKYIFPFMFHILIGILIFSFLFSSPFIPFLIPIFDFFIKMINLSVMVFFLLAAIFIWGPLFIGHMVFNRFLVKYYLSTAKIQLENNRIIIDVLNERKKYNVSRIINLNELKSYAISDSIAITGGINLGIMLVTKEEKFAIRLYDYRMTLFGNFTEIKGILNFSKALKNYIDTYNRKSNRQIKFHIPTKWRRGFRTFYSFLGATFAFLLLGIFITLYLSILTKLNIL